ncbi:MFS transporter [Micromonospora sp. WMMD980]|uniref:MFS transporter n=1 Tax=Micromonospora sp. WMMD980 TaxID=3016088 RepID=UPI002415C0BE|nr:MFS transporter [Micromonospora sp. WMMD980]MDG4803598.1 MFS transporter [Micromonospora sp. WMMD980]
MTTATSTSLALPTAWPRAAGWRLAALYGPGVYGVTAAAVALPAAAGPLRSGGAGIAWILTAYAAGMGVGAVTAGRLIDLKGDRDVLVVTVLILIAGAMLCLMAPSLPVLVAGRVVLAIGSGAAKAIALAGIARLPPARRPAGLTAFGVCLAMFCATAPLAGAVAAHLSWRAPLILPVLSIAVAPVGWSLTTRLATPRPIDWKGAGLCAVTAAGLLLAVQTLSYQTHAVPATAAALTAATGIALAARSRHSQLHQFVPGEVIRAGWFWWAAATGAGAYAGLFAICYAGPSLLHQHGFTTMGIGVLLLPSAAIAAGLTRTVGRLARRVSARRLLTTTSVLLAVALSCTAAAPHPITIVCCAAVAFTASASAQMLLNVHVSGHSHDAARSAAVGLLALTLFLGGGCGTAILVAIWQLHGLVAAMAAVAGLALIGAVAARQLRD